MAIFSIYSTVNTNTTIKYALENKNACLIVQGNIENYRYVNGKELTDFTVDSINFRHARLSTGYNPEKNSSFSSLHKYYDHPIEKLQSKVKIAYIIIGNDPKIIKIWSL